MVERKSFTSGAFIASNLFAAVTMTLSGSSASKGDFNLLGEKKLKTIVAYKEHRRSG